MTAWAQDGAGNLSAPATQYFNNLTQVTIQTNLAGALTKTVTNLLPGQAYSVTAGPGGPGELFYGWNSNGVTTLDPALTFIAGGNVTLTAMYVSTNLSAGLAMTNPAPGAQALAIESALTLGGTLPSLSVTQLTCQFFVNSNAVFAAKPATINGTNWSVTVSNLSDGDYLVAALATDAAGDSSVALNNLSLLNVEQFNLTVVGEGSAPGYPGRSYTGYAGDYAAPGVYTLTAAAASGYVFYSWNNGVVTTLNRTNTVNLQSNLNLTVTFAPEDTALKGITFTYPPANARLTSGTFSVEGRLPASQTFTQMTCQLFLQSNGVTASPQAVSMDSATKWHLPVAQLTPGPYTVVAVAYDGAGKARLVSENFNLLAKLAAGVQPAGAGAVTAGLNGKYLEVGKTYHIAATPKAGQVFAFWRGGAEVPLSPATTFVMSNNTMLTANFTNNPFPAVAGTYNGIFVNTNIASPSNCGFLALTLNRSGVFSGKVVMPAFTIPIYSAKFLYDGTFSNPAEKNTGGLEFFFALDLSSGADFLGGAVSYPGAWTNSIHAFRAVTALSSSSATAPGKYVVTLQPTNGSAGSPTAPGYAAVTVEKNGTVVLAGTLPDNTAISKSVGISKEGLCPVFVVPAGYKGRGMIFCWLTNWSSIGETAWIRPAAGGTYYPGGFDTGLSAAGTNYVPPAAGTTYQIVFGGGSLGSNAVVTDILTVKNGHFVPPPDDTNKLGISLLSTGVVTGHLLVDGKPWQFKGAFKSPSQGGSGFTLDGTEETGYFNLSFSREAGGPALRR